MFVSKNIEDMYTPQSHHYSFAVVLQSLLLNRIVNATKTWMTVLQTKLCESPLPAITMHLWLFIRCFSYGDKQVRRVNFVCSLVGASEVHKKDIPPLKRCNHCHKLFKRFAPFRRLCGLTLDSKLMPEWFQNLPNMIPKYAEHDPQIMPK